MGPPDWRLGMLLFDSPGQAGLRVVLCFLSALAWASCSSESPAGSSSEIRLPDRGRTRPDAGPAEACTTDSHGHMVLEADARTRTGRVVTLRHTYRPDEDQLNVEEVLTVSGSVLQRAHRRGTDTRFEVDASYGREVTGIRALSYVVADGMFIGEIDGRSTGLVPIADVEPSRLTFADGSPLPDARFPADVQDVHSALLGEMRMLLDRCGGAAPGPRGPRSAISGSWGGSYDPGHDSDPESSAECYACRFSCHVAAGACLAGVIGGCVWTGPLGLFCGIGGTAGCLATLAGCLGLCHSVFCCPVGCGGLNICCNAGESCLSTTTGLCCSEGRTPCHGRSCCGDTEVCMPSGDFRGLCCRPQNVCHDNCCTDAQGCISEGANAGTCCLPDNICNGDCCGDDEACLPTGPFEDDVCCDAEHSCGEECCGDLESCNEATGTCCGFGSPVCGDGCCEVGDVCLGGETCCPSGRACGDTCCPEGSGCDPETGECAAPCPDGGTYCSATGSCCAAGTYCSPVAGVCCGEGEYYCDGRCRPVDECIH